MDALLVGNYPHALGLLGALEKARTIARLPAEGESTGSPSARGGRCGRVVLLHGKQSKSCAATASLRERLDAIAFGVRQADGSRLTPHEAPNRRTFLCRGGLQS